MKIENLASLPAGGEIEADIIIIGAGPAGLSIARELGGTDVRVIVCESGVLGQHEKYYHLNKVEAKTDQYFDPKSPFRMTFFTNGNPVWNPETEPYGSRVRGYGGSTAFWGGKAAVFDENDFKKREWVPYSGWPIALSDVSPYFDRAGDLVNLGPHVYNDDLWPMLGKRKPEPHLDTGRLKTTFWQYSRSRINKMDIVRFHRDHVNIEGDNLTTLLNATVTRIDLQDDQKSFKGVEVSTLEGERYYIKGTTCIIAASAIENPRLLLANTHQMPDGIGNQNDVVGRFLMDHPGGKIGQFTGSAIKKVSRQFGFFGLQNGDQTHMYMHGLLLSAEKQAEEGLLNAALFALEGISPDDPFMAAGRLVKFKSKNPLKDVMSIISSSGLMIKGIGMKILEAGVVPEGLRAFVINTAIRLNPNMVVREYQSLGVPHKLTSLDLFSLSEQHPNPESRIRLGESKDDFGMPRALVQWRLTEFESRSIMRLAQIMADEFEAKGLPRPTFEDWITHSRPAEARLSDMAHPTGTTRMGDDPKTSVVDANCKVHGIDGLYIAGSSVFPTSGQANPTLMIMTLAIRLAEHLKSKSVKVTPAPDLKPEPVRAVG
jgi:choline dehydrogenase-like flavoprotein